MGRKNVAQGKARCGADLQVCTVVRAAALGMKPPHPPSFVVQPCYGVDCQESTGDIRRGSRNLLFGRFVKWIRKTISFSTLGTDHTEGRAFTQGCVGLVPCESAADRCDDVCAYGTGLSMRLLSCFCLWEAVVLHAATAVCHMRIARRRIVATKAFFLRFGFLVTIRS